MSKASPFEAALRTDSCGRYSTIWLARALPEGGSVTTLELDEKHARVLHSLP